MFARMRRYRGYNGADVAAKLDVGKPRAYNTRLLVLVVI
jgi:hypothetical protein